ncbi:MAG TPA: DUF1552 domain-containing protein [Polyangia bacterium]|jgi:hypothetical protein|nr:DUF1552 domain-containing protein [Polyangia bacterium]
MHRRVFLRGLGGAAVAAPFLSSVAEREAKGQSTAKQKQFIAMFTHYGCITTKFFPAKSHGALTAADLTATNLGVLAPFVNKILIPRGIRGMNEWTQNNRGSGASAGGRGQANDPHLNVVGSYFTLQPVTPSGTDPFSFDTAYKFNALPIGSSLDHVMAQQLSPQGTPLFMRVGNRNDGAQSGISYLKDASAATNAAAKAYPGLGQPSQVFSALTGLFGMGGTTPATYAALRGKKITDCVKDDLASFERINMSAEDRNKVAVWKSLLNDMTPIVTSNMCTMDLANSIGATSTNVNKQTSNITSAVTTDLDGADMYSVMAVLASICNYNPVIFLKYPPNYVFSGLNITMDSHNLSHRLDNAGMSGTCYPNSLNLLQTIDKYYASKFAKLIGMLDNVKNSDGSTLLDSSAAVWFNEMSDGNAHNLNNLPIIQAGGLNGYFKTGWAVNVDTAMTGAANLSNGASESQCMNDSGMVNGLNQSTGTNAMYANAPINKYFYNIMNGMGVKGDANGYPAKGGTAPVSKFGYSDKTEDFAGGYGAKTGAGIHSEGEYTALKP